MPQRCSPWPTPLSRIYHHESHSAESATLTCMKRMWLNLLIGVVGAFLIPSCSSSVVALSTDCPSGQKPCTEPGTGTGLCVSTMYPAYGCGATTCQPCTTLLPGTNAASCSNN